MDDKENKGYHTAIPDEMFQEALQSVQKHMDPDAQADDETTQDLEGNENSSDSKITIEVEEDEQPGGNDSYAEERAVLQEELDKVRNELKSTEERMLRVAAEADNTRKRAHKERQDAIKYGKEQLFRDILPIVDNLERTMEHLPESVNDDAWKTLREGVQMVLQMFKETLERHHLVGFDAVGQPFDPARHEALSQCASSDAEPGTVVSQMHRGYMLHDRLLRPALVVVACPAEENQPQSAGDDKQDTISAAEEKKLEEDSATALNSSPEDE